LWRGIALFPTKAGVLRLFGQRLSMYPVGEGAKLQAKKAVGFFSTMPGRLELVQLHALNGVQLRSEGF